MDDDPWLTACEALVEDLSELETRAEEVLAALRRSPPETAQRSVELSAALRGAKGHASRVAAILDMALRVVSERPDGRAATG